MDLLPDELACQLANNSLPWDQSSQVHINNFLSDYTLHDSLWITLHIDCAYEDAAIAAIAFDPIWNRSIAPVTEKCEQWPMLFLWFSSVSGVEMSGFSDIGGMQRGISSVQVTRSSDEEVCTEVLDHYGAAVRIKHWPLVRVLVMTTNAEVVQLKLKGP